MKNVPYSVDMTLLWWGQKPSKELWVVESGICLVQATTDKAHAQFSWPSTSKSLYDPSLCVQMSHSLLNPNICFSVAALRQLFPKLKKKEMQYNPTQHCWFEDVYLFISLDRWNDNGGWRRSWKCLKVEMIKNQYSKDSNDILHQADIDDSFFLIQSW